MVFQSPDFNPIKDIWTVLKNQVRAKTLINLVKLHCFGQKSDKNSARGLHKLVDGYQKHLLEV